MRKISLLPLVGLLLLGACTAKLSPEPEASDNSGLWGLIETWAPDIGWSAPTAGTNDYDIFIDDTRSIQPGMIQTTFITSTVSAQEYEETFVSGTSRNALTSMMELSGFRPHLSLDADGVMGTQWGYSLQSDAGLELMIISAIGKDCTEGEDIPVTCSTYTAAVTRTAAVAEGDDL